MTSLSENSILPFSIKMQTEVQGLPKVTPYLHLFLFKPLFLLYFRNIPDNYKVLFLQGGCSGMFAAVPLNFLSGKSVLYNESMMCCFPTKHNVRYVSKMSSYGI